MDAKPFPHRSALAYRVYSDFGFHAPSGATQRASCLKALRDLESRDLNNLPLPLTPGGHGQPRVESQVI